ncbi:LysE family translocator [Hydrocarboniphaga effusa]|jgi:threonine/homoserine/homoserine lactone efflux protein|uniref:LysE family translocator n=1 Tax=Hydrocarboniphaga effusa TaxID=243629 RepID=UPI0035AFF8EC
MSATLSESPQSLFALVAAAHLLAVSSPGPDFAMVARQTLAHGRSTGVWTALGIGSGIAFHVAWAMFGLGWVVERFPLLLELLRYGGAAFLLYMGVSALRARPTPPAEPSAAGAVPGSARSFGIGLATNLLNPKVMMFFVALCSTVITRDTSIALRLGLGAWMAGTTMLWFSLVAWGLGHQALRERLQKQAHWIDRGMGVLLVGLGLLSLLPVN